MLNAADIKRQNRQGILSLLINCGRTTKTDLAARSGLSIPTVYTIISGMEERGMIERVHETNEPITLGRPRQYLRLNGNSRYAIGVRYDGELLVYGLMNLCGRMLAVRVQRILCSTAQLMELLSACVEDLLRSARVESSCVIGMGVGLEQDMFPDARQIAALEEKLGFSVLIGVGAHFAVVGEYVSYKQKIDSMMFVSLGTTVACGLLVDGHVLLSGSGRLGRIGSMILQDGATLDDFIGRRALRQRFGMPPDYDRAGACAYVVKHLVVALHNLTLGCEVSTIVLGGDVAARLGASLINGVKEELERLSGIPVQVQRQSCATPAVLGAAFGALYQSLDEILGTNE